MKQFRNNLSVLAGAVLALAVTGSPRVASAQISLPWGTTLLAGDQWLGGQGVNVYWNGTPTCNTGYIGGNSYTTYNGTQYYTGEQYQCGELPFRLYTTLDWHLGAWPDRYAYQMYTSPPAEMQTHPNGSGYIPAPGDCVVWNHGHTTDVSGHVAVVNYVDPAYVYVCEQNNCNAGVAALIRSGTNGSFLTRQDGWGAGALLGCVHSPSNSLVSFSNPHINPCVARTSDGRLELFAIGNTGFLYHNYETSPGGAWSGWNALGTSSNVWTKVGLPTVGVNADGRLEVFIIGTDGSVNHNYQKVAGSSAATNWSGFSVLQASFVSQTSRLAAGRMANGSLHLYVIGTDSVVYHTYQSSGGWTSWGSLGGVGLAYCDMAAASEQDGREEVFLMGGNGALYHTWQTAPNGTNWNGLASLGGSFSPAGRFAVGTNPDGRLEAFAIGNDGIAYHAWETASNSPASWSNWSSLGGTWETDSKPVVAADQNGALEVFLVGSGGNLFHNYQTSGGSWSGWLNLSGTFTQNIRPCVGQNQSGTLQIFLTGTSADMQTASETSANSATWSAWTSLGGTWQ